jgi:hypothetical protein
MLAGHAAREGARELATDPTYDRKKPKLNPYEKVAREDLPSAWRKGAKVTLPGDEDEVRPRVRVQLDVPIVIPGLKSGFTIASSADTTIETEDLAPYQQLTPTPTPTPDDERT